MAQIIHAWYSGKFQSLCGIAGVNKTAGLVRHTSIPVNCPGCLRELLVRGFDENKHELTPQEFATSRKNKSTSIISDVYNMPVDSIVKNTEITIQEELAKNTTLEKISPIEEILEAQYLSPKIEENSPVEEWIEPETQQVIQQKIFSSPGVGEFGVVSPISENNPIIISPIEEFPPEKEHVNKDLQNSPEEDELVLEDMLEEISLVEGEIDETPIEENIPIIKEIPLVGNNSNLIVEEIEVTKSLSSKPAPKKKTTKRK